MVAPADLVEDLKFAGKTRSSGENRRYLLNCNTMFPVLSAKSCLVILLFCLPAWGQTPVVVYENSAQYEGVFEAISQEYGDEVILAGTARLVTEIDLEYTGDYTAGANQDAIIRFYEN